MYFGPSVDLQFIDKIVFSGKLVFEKCICYRIFHNPDHKDYATLALHLRSGENLAKNSLTGVEEVATHGDISARLASAVPRTRDRRSSNRFISLLSKRPPSWEEERKLVLSES